MSNGTVFLVDDDASVLKALTRLLKDDGLDVNGFQSAEDFLIYHDMSAPGCAVFDVGLGTSSGLDLMRALALGGQTRPTVFITGSDDIPTCVRAMRLGAIDFLSKPIEGETLLDAVYRGIERDRDDRARRAKVAAGSASVPASHGDLPPEAIQDALKRVIGSSVFRTSPILVAFLRFIVERALAKDERAIKAYVIGVAAMGLRTDFDPSTNAIVRVTAKRLREAIRRYYESEGANDPVRIRVERGSYMPRFVHSNGNESDGLVPPAAASCHARLLIEEAAEIRARMRAMLADLHEAIGKSRANLAQSRSAVTSVDRSS
jgi:ActR/RegA family two-component response regulator